MSNTNATVPDPNEWNGQSAAANAAASLALAAIAVALRLWARFGILRVAGLEDWLVLAALLFSVGLTVCLGLELQHGLGRHVLYVSAYDFMMFFKLSIIVTMIYVLSMICTKLSILCLYIRILTYDHARFAAKILLAIVLVSHVYILATLATACVPLDAFWDFSKRETSYCHPQSIYWSHAGLNIVTDFLIFLLPLSIIHKIRSPKPQKIALCVIFVLAFSVCIISLTRVALLARDLDRGMTDVTWDAVSTATWNSWEINMAIVCACLTTMKPVVTRFFPSLLSPYPSTLLDEDIGEGYAQGERGLPAQRGREVYMVDLSEGSENRSSARGEREDSSVGEDVTSHSWTTKNKA